MGCVLEGPTLQCICEPQAVHEHFFVVVGCAVVHDDWFSLLIVFVSAAISQMMTWPKSDS